MTGDYTRFEHALRGMEAGRFSWKELPDTAGVHSQTSFSIDWHVGLYNGKYTVGLVGTEKMGELICSAVNYMLGLKEQIGADEDYRDDMLARAQTALRAAGQIDLADEIRMHLDYTHKVVPNAK